MRLGVCGMLPPDFRNITHVHLESIRELGLTGAAFHASGNELFDIGLSECTEIRKIYGDTGMDLPQFGIAYNECLFDRDAHVRSYALNKINCGIEIARDLDAHTALVRTGSLNPAGSYSPCKENFEDESRDRLIESLIQIAAKAEKEGVMVTIETHALTIMGSPQINKEIISTVGSHRLGVVMDYVNHFESMHQVYNSTERLNHIYSVMGPVSPIAHCKDIRVRPGLVLHIEEAIPGEGEIDMSTALKRWDEINPSGYMLLEHLENEQYPRASASVRRICTESDIQIH